MDTEFTLSEFIIFVFEIDFRMYSQNVVKGSIYVSQDNVLLENMKNFPVFCWWWREISRKMFSVSGVFRENSNWNCSTQICIRSVRCFAVMCISTITQATLHACLFWEYVVWVFLTLVCMLPTNCDQASYKITSSLRHIVGTIVIGLSDL